MATQTTVKPTPSTAARSKKAAAKTTTSRAKTTLKKVNKSDIQPRKMDFEFDPDIPLYWFDNDQFKTLLLTALSCTFPEGERFFVRSVRHFQGNLQDAKLKEEVKGFIGQEAHHGNEHEQFNAFMRSKGLPTDEVEQYVLDGLKWMSSWMSPERQLAKTCALEHFTAMLAEMILENPDVLDGMDERMKPLWLWHAVEESEHKAVAYDVYQDQVDNYWIRASEMAVTTVEFIGFTALHYIQLRRGMDTKTDWRSVRNGFNWLVGNPGWLRKQFGSYMSYYRPGFHPNDRDSKALRKKGLNMLAKMLNRPELASAA